MRYLKAFWQALVLTLKGQTLQPQRQSPPEYQAYLAWIEEGQRHLQNLHNTLEAHQWDQARRSAYTLRIDSRPMSLELLLQNLAFHFQTDYLRTLEINQELSLAVIRANNLNDHYHLLKFQESPDLQWEPLQSKLDLLMNHLESLSDLS